MDQKQILLLIQIDINCLPPTWWQIIVMVKNIVWVRLPIRIWDAWMRHKKMKEQKR